MAARMGLIIAQGRSAPYGFTVPLHVYYGSIFRSGGGAGTHVGTPARSLAYRCTRGAGHVSRGGHPGVARFLPLRRPQI